MVFTKISFAYFGGKRKEERRTGRNGKDNAGALRAQRFTEKRKT
jgi:hypothetical protein